MNRALFDELHGKRLLFFVGSLELGGAERQAIWLAHYFAKTFGARVELWGIGEPGEAMRQALRYGITSRLHALRWSHLEPGRQIGLEDLLMDVRRFQPDAILSYTHFANLLCGLIWKWSGARAFIWNQGDAGVGRQDRRFEMAAIRHTRRFIANAKHVRQFLVNEFGVDESSCAVVPNGIQMEPAAQTRAEWRAELGVDDDTFLLGVVANIRKVKGHEQIIEAWAKVLPRLTHGGRRARLLLAGRPDDASDVVQKLISDRGLENSVTLLGGISDVSGFLSAIDLSALTSHTEGCPYSVMETLSVGTPFVGSHIPGIREAVGDDYGAWLAEPGDYAGLADRILKVAAGEGPSLALRQQAQQRIANSCTGEHQGAQTAAVLAEEMARLSPIEALAGYHTSYPSVFDFTLA